MSFPVHFVCAYYSQRAHETVSQRHGQYWDAYKFCKAVKAGTINGRLTVPFKKSPITLTSENAAEARRIFGRIIVKRLQGMGISEAALVPVPSKDALVGGSEDFRSFKMVRDSMDGHKGFEVLPLLRYTREMAKASQGGTRDRQALFASTCVIQRTKRRPIILVDDLLTLGGSMLAARDRLQEADMPVECAFVAGRTVWDFLMKPFDNHTIHIDESPFGSIDFDEPF